jgi:SAM-dependent methyltransferase
MTDPMPSTGADDHHDHAAHALHAAVEHAHSGPTGPDGADDWDARYAAEDQWWSGEPNGSLLAEVGGVAPGRAIDLGCGEGADAIWLARQGWAVEGVDVSTVAVERARAVGERAGVRVDWRVLDLRSEAPTVDGFDLVVSHYPALPKGTDGVLGAATLDRILDAVAPGGTLLVVGHALTHDARRHAADHGFEPDDYLQPGDVVAAVAGREGWVLEVDEHRPRTGVPASIAIHAEDHVVRARRA